MTALDVSANSLGTAGLMPVVVALEGAFGMMPKLAVKVRETERGVMIAFWRLDAAGVVLLFMQLGITVVI